MKFITLILLVFFLLFFLTSCGQPDQEWNSYGEDLTNQRFSKITQINKTNVEKLGLAWQFQTGVKATFQATPIVHKGIMYVSLPFNSVVALDAVTGKEIWRYIHELNPNWKICCGPSNRGVAINGNQIFFGTVDARLISLNIKTGEKIWDVNVVKNTVQTESINDLDQSDSNSEKKISGGTGVGISMAPIVYKGKVIIGITGVGYGLHVGEEDDDTPLGAVVGVSGNYGRSGFLAAYDIHSGQKIWQFNTIAETGWEGNFSNFIEDGLTLNRDIYKEKANLEKYPNSSKFGGGSAWTTPAVDEETDTLFFGTGNPSPQMSAETRPGDNLYTVSIVALNAETGKLKWYYQQVPHDIWGYDVASPPVLFYAYHNNQVIPAVAQASKTGWLYIINRDTGALILKSEAFVPQSNLFAGASKEGTIIYPGILGGSNWSPISINSDLNLAYVSGIHAPIKYTLHEKNTDNGTTEYTSSEPTNDPQWGLLSAINLSTGKIQWQYKTPQPLIGGTLSTKGGLVFIGEGNGNFNAIDASTGNLLWQTTVDAGVNAPPISYMIEGEQYIAVVAGGNKIMGFPQGDYINVYKLPKSDNKK
jgi:glucose dehydrogenase